MDSDPIILFDGVCNFCNSAVNFAIKRDKKSVLKFAPLQSQIAKKILKSHHLSADDFRSFVFIENNIAYTSSTAALRVFKHLDQLWPLMYGFIIVPKFLRDGVYNWISRHRYRWFGKKEICMVPTPELRPRFLNEAI